MTHAATTHGMCYTKTYRVWDSMKQRCLNEKNKSFKNYGGRGIKICDEWLSFDRFFADMGERPVGRTLDRVDNSLGYYKENCRWATILEQSRNRRVTLRIEVNGVSRTIGEWSEHTGLTYLTIFFRHKKGVVGDRLLAPPHPGAWEKRA